MLRVAIARFGRCFNTQPPEGGWIRELWYSRNGEVSTHSRLKAAG